MTGQLLRVKDVAALTGVKESTLYGWRAEGRGPASFLLGGVVVYDAAQLDEWIRRQQDTTSTGGQS